MFKVITILTLSVFLSFSGFLYNSNVKAQTTIKVVGNLAPPFRIFNGKNCYGIYFDVMKEIGKRIGAVVEFQNQPFKRALMSIREGSADIICGPNRTSERESYMVYVNPALPRANKAFYVAPDSQTIIGYEDLKSKKIATHRGSIYFDRFDQDPFLKKAPVNSYEQAIKKVFMKRDDVVIMPEQEGDYLLKELGINLTKSPFVVEGNKAYITISKKSSVLNLKSRIEEAMSQINRDGTMERILREYK